MVGSDIVDAERALERLFRLTVNRRLHERQAAVIGTDVTRAGYAVLRCLHEAGALSLGELARLCSMDPAAAGRQVRKLQDDDLIERSAGTDDARMIVVRLAPRGAEVYRRIAAMRTAHMGDVLAAWSGADRTALVRLVGRLVDDLETTPFRPSDIEEPR